MKTMNLRTLAVVILAMLCAVAAMAQMAVPASEDITTYGPVQIGTAAGALTFGSMTVNGVLKNPAGVVAWAASPFRYKAFFYGVADTTMKSDAVLTSVADTLAATGSTTALYPCVLTLPGAFKITCTPAGSDTVWARAYYK